MNITARERNLNILSIIIIYYNVHFILIVQIKVQEMLLILLPVKVRNIFHKRKKNGLNSKKSLL